MRAEVTPSIIPHGRRLAAARAVWVALVSLTVGVYIVGVPTLYESLKTVCAGENCTQWRLSPEGASALREAGLSVELYAAAGIALSALSALVFLAVAALLFWRKSDERMALLLSFYLVLNLPGSNFLYELSQEQPAWSSLVMVLGYLSTALFIPVFYLFPDGRFIPSWTRILAVVWVALQFPYYFFPNSLPDSQIWFVWLSGIVFIAYLLSIVFAQGYRYRYVSSPVERQQTKWVVFGLAVTILGWLLLALIAEGFLLPILYGEFAGIAIDPFSILLPLSIGLAVLRYRLWDIDVVINRTLVYGALTACVVGLYIFVVGYLGTLFHTSGSLLISLIATGIVAVLFQPLRYRLQRGVNHLMYGERDDPYRVLSRLGERLEATLEPRAVLPAIVETVAQALKLPYAAIALKESGENDEFTIVAAWGSPVDTPVCLPLVYQHETVGELLLGPRTGEEAFSPADRRLLDDLARQAGIATHAVRLTTDLQRARERLVSAREEERRRLRRNLHDGLGPQLSSQTLTIDAIRALMRRDPDAAERLLVDLKAQAQDAITDIRRLVYDLRPPTLDDLGLVGAIRESATQHGQNGLSVSVEVPEELPALPAAVEVAAYRIAREALTNAVRHAKADSCTVSLGVDDDAGAFHLEVRDDGRGIGESRGSGVGLTSMRERAEELGGSLTVETPPEGGTVVRTQLPLPEEG